MKTATMTPPSGPKLTLRQLRLLVALDDRRTIAGAADQAGTSQPAASRQLKEIETLLGARLFTRGPRGVEPTVFGTPLIARARVTLTSLAQAFDDVSALRHGMTGQVEVGVIMTAAMSLLPSAIARVKRESPLLRIGVAMDVSHVLLDHLMKGRLDFMIGRIDSPLEGLCYEELQGERIVIASRRHHPVLECRRLDLAWLAVQPWILPPCGSALRHRFDMMFRRAGLAPPANVVDATCMLLTTALLGQSDALQLMPAEVAQHYADMGLVAICPIDPPCKMDPFGIIRRKDRLLSPGAQCLLSALRGVARPDADRAWAKQ